MKKPKEWFEEELSGEPLTQESVIECIKMVQQELIDYVVQRCANEADADFTYLGDNLKECGGEYIEVYVIKSSILNVADTIKSELK
jgi:hypothetical protein